MTAETKFRLGSLQKFPLLGMYDVTIVARDLPVLMPAHIPECVSPHFFMAGEAFFRPYPGIDFFAEIDDIHPASTAFFHMLGAGAVAGLTGLLELRPVRLFF
jgi:hypothetical protein